MNISTYLLRSWSLRCTKMFHAIARHSSHIGTISCVQGSRCDSHGHCQLLTSWNSIWNCSGSQILVSLVLDIVYRTRKDSFGHQIVLESSPCFLWTGCVCASHELHPQRERERERPNGHIFNSITLLQYDFFFILTHSNQILSS